MSARTMTCEECNATFPTHPSNVIEVLRVVVEDIPADPEARAKTKAFMLEGLPISEGQADDLLEKGELRIYGILCASCGDAWAESEEEGGEANARLAESAPDLLAALKAAVAYPITGNWYEQACAAIAKAEGGAE